MALQFILGSCGSGKSYHLYHDVIVNSMNDPNGKYIILVPEQFSMETQKDLVRLHPRKGSMNIDIVSFGRLALRVFEEIGTKNLTVLDDTGKNLILRKILEDKKKSLILYGSKLKSPGFVSEVKSILSEFYQYSIHGEEIDSILSLTKSRPMLHAKLTDMKTIVQAFEAYIEEKYITKEEILDVLCRVVENSKKLKDCTIYLDGFTGFTPIQYKLLGHLIKLASKVVVTVTLDDRENPDKRTGEQELFHLSREMIYHLSTLSDQMGVQRLPHIRVSKDADSKKPLYRFREQNELASLEKNLFRYTYEPYPESTNGIFLYAASNPQKESEYAARQIQKLVREDSYRYQDIAVITGDLERYADLLQEALKKHNIPYFLDQKNTIMGNPFVEFIRGSLGVIADNYSYESVFRYLRSGLSDMVREDIDYLENYCIALGIRGRKRWNSQWIRNVRRGLALDLDYVNQLRLQVTDQIEPLWENWGNMGTTIRSRMEVLHQFIVKHHIHEKLIAFADEFEQSKQLAKAKEYRQIYRLIMDLFDKVVDLLGEECISRKELGDILDAGFEEIKVGLIPPSMDQILVGDIERTRLKDIKALFFVGVNDGIIPKNGNKGGLISQIERSFLSEHQVTLAPTVKQHAYTQRFYLYMNLTKPSRQLYISYSATSGEGAAIRPSYLVPLLKRLFPAISTIEDQADCDTEYITTPAGSFPYWIYGLRKSLENENVSDVWHELFSWYLSKDDWKERTRHMVEAAFYRNQESGISRLAAASLYGPQPMNSVTRLEQYAACAFAHFLSYGLQVKPRQEFEIAAMDMGNMFHNAIERYSKKLKEQNLSFRAASEDLQKKLVHDAVMEVTTDYGNQVLQGSARNAYMIDRLERITGRTVWALTNQLKKGRFEPVNYEVVFSEQEGLSALTIPLDGSDSMKLQGRIDRMDIYEDDEHVYVKVLDYKSGSTFFDLSSVYYGLQLQLIVYLNAALESEKIKHPDKLVIPAGVLYYNIKDPIIDKEELGDEDTVDSKLLEELRMNGLVNQDQTVIQLMDQTMDKKSDVLPVSYTKDGVLSKNSSCASPEQFERLMEHVRNLMKDMGEAIQNGKTQIEPYEKGQQNACDFCKYKFVCGFDEKVAGYQKKQLPPLSPKEIWKLMEAAESEETDK